MDWKKFLFGVTPTTVVGLRKELKFARLFFSICIVTFVIIFFGVKSMNDEINSCWSELQPLRISQAVNTFTGGFPINDCDVDDGYVVCNIDNFSVIT